MSETTSPDWRTMEAGRELNAVVAERVMGWTYWRSKHGHWVVRDASGGHHEPTYGFPEYDDRTGERLSYPWTTGVDLPDFSDDIAAAWPVVDALRPRGVFRVTIEMDGGKYAATLDGHDRSWDSGDWCATPAEAICRAALAVVEA